LPRGIDKIYPRGDSVLYEHDLRRWLDELAIGYAISADISPQLAECIAALPEGHWKPIDAIRKWAEVNYLPDDAKKGCEGDRGDLGVLVEFSGDSPLKGSRIRTSRSRVSHVILQFLEWPATRSEQVGRPTKPHAGQQRRDHAPDAPADPQPGTLLPRLIPGTKLPTPGGLCKPEQAGA
jgi:hypothetical protein